MGRRGGGGGSRGANARDLKMYLRHGLWREHSSALLAVAVIAVALFSGVVLRFVTSPTLLHRVDATTDPALVARVFRSGEPWLVLCARADDVLPDIFGDAAQRLAGRVHAGVLDCSQPLSPGTKSALQRYKLRATVTPTVFTVANGEKPQQIFLDHLQSPKALVKRALAQTKKNAKEVLNSAQLDLRCLQKPTCVLLLRGRKLSPYEKQWFDKIQQEHRTLQFAWLDATRLKLSIESLLPEFVDGEHRLVLFRRKRDPSGAKHKGGVVTAKAFRNVFDPLPVGIFLKEHANRELKALAKAPTLSRRSAAKTSLKSKKKQKEESDGDDSSDSSTASTAQRRSRASEKQQRVAEEEKGDEYDMETATGNADPSDAADDDDVEVLDLDLDLDDE